MGPGRSRDARRRKKLSEFGRGLIEKQKIKLGYGLTEKQMKILFQRAHRMRSDTALNLLTLMERRFDNVIYKMGFASSIHHARQLISHGHFCVNGKKVNIPSFLLELNNVISIKKEKSQDLISAVIEQNDHRPAPDWLTKEKEKKEGFINRLPQREEMSQFGDEQLVVEFYSR